MSEEMKESREKLTKIKIPLFDLDGTVFKAGNTVHNQSFDYAFENVYGIKASQNEIDTQGKTDKQIVLEVLALHGLNREQAKAKLDDAQKTMVDYFLKNCNSGDYFVLPGVRDLLAKLKEAGIPIGVLTGNQEAIAWKKLEIAGIKDYFDFGAFGGVTDKRVELVEIAKKRADGKFGVYFPVENFVIIGDTPKDIACAKDAGIPVIAVSSGTYSYGDLGKNSPDLLVYSLTEQDKVMDFLTK